MAQISLNPYSTGNEVVGIKSSLISDLKAGSLNPYSTGNEVVGSRFEIHAEVWCLNPYSTGNEVVGAPKRR